jgi:adenylate cyclase
MRPMAMVTDPVCGMRIDPDDAVASAEHDGTQYWFCSEACRDAFVNAPGESPELLTLEDLAARSGASAERLRELAGLGILEPDAGRFPRRDVMRARSVTYLETLGIAAQDLAAALASGHLKLGYLESASRRHPRAGVTHRELAGQLGLAYESLERTYVAFGLRRPDPDERVREEDMAILQVLSVLMGAGLAEDDVLRMARVWGESARRVAQYLPHYFHATIEEGFRRRGLGDNAAYESAVRDVGVRVGASGEDLLGWLFRRHSETYMTAHQIEHVETALEEAGLRLPAPQRPEAVAFADLSGYTELTEVAGDEVAADTSIAFAALVGEVANEHRGTVVKLLGDGVLLHFSQPADAVRASLDLVARLPSRRLPPAHVGIEAGQLLYDEGDYFGRTVNIAARIAAQAKPGQVLTGESLVAAVEPEGFALQEVGEFELKGLSRPMRLHEAVAATRGGP